MSHTCLILLSRSWSSFTDTVGWQAELAWGWLVTKINVRHPEIKLNPDKGYYYYYYYCDYYYYYYSYSYLLSKHRACCILLTYVTYVYLVT